MTYLIQVENETLTQIDPEQEARKMLDFIMDYLHCPYEAEISLTVTDNETIRVCNRDYRNTDKATDVLSFPMVDYKRPFDFSVAEASQEDYFNPESGELLLGDIMISADKVIEQAAAFGHSVRREYCFLITHSLLHLFGYDHIEEEDRLIMEKLQDEIMNAAGIYR